VTVTQLESRGKLVRFVRSSNFFLCLAQLQVGRSPEGGILFLEIMSAVDAFFRIASILKFGTLFFPFWFFWSFHQHRKAAVAGASLPLFPGSAPGCQSFFFPKMDFHLFFKPLLFSYGRFSMPPMGCCDPWAFKFAMNGQE